MKESKTKTIGYKQYCIYCGAEAQKDTEWDEYHQDKSFYCDCTGGKLEQKANELLEQAKKTITHEVYKKLDKIEYEYKLAELKDNYGIND